MSTQSVSLEVLTCPTDGKILGSYCKVGPQKYECPRCRRILSESEVKA